MTFKKYPKIERLGSDDNRDILHFNEDIIIVEEKVDGGNGSFWLEDGIIHVGSRNRDLVAEKDDKTFAKQRLNLMNILASRELNPDYIYYIEWMAKHTINYTNAPDVIGLDIRLKHNQDGDGVGMFLGRSSREQEFKRLGIINIPLVWRGTVAELKASEIDKIVPQSKFYNGRAEGIVIKNYIRKHPSGNHQLYAKVVTDEFKEDNKAVFGGIRQQVSDTSKIVDQYVTDARIRKAIHKFVNEEGEELSLKLMHKVPTYVIKDVIAEEFDNIFSNYSFIDFKIFKQKAAKLCLKVLNEEITISGGKNE